MSCLFDEAEIVHTSKLPLTYACLLLVNYRSGVFDELDNTNVTTNRQNQTTVVI
jgi:hypothetical protein